MSALDDTRLSLLNSVDATVAAQRERDEARAEVDRLTDFASTVDSDLAGALLQARNERDLLRTEVERLAHLNGAIERDAALALLAAVEALLAGAEQDGQGFIPVSAVRAAMGQEGPSHV